MTVGRDVIPVLCFGALCVMAGVGLMMFVQAQHRADQDLSRRIYDLAADMHARTGELHRMVTASKAPEEAAR